MLWERARASALTRVRACGRVRLRPRESFLGYACDEIRPCGDYRLRYNVSNVAGTPRSINAFQFLLEVVMCETIRLRTISSTLELPQPMKKGGRVAVPSGNVLCGADGTLFVVWGNTKYDVNIEGVGDTYLLRDAKIVGGYAWCSGAVESEWKILGVLHFLAAVSLQGEMVVETECKGYRARYVVKPNDVSVADEQVYSVEFSLVEKVWLFDLPMIVRSAVDNEVYFAGSDGVARMRDYEGTGFTILDVTDAYEEKDGMFEGMEFSDSIAEAVTNIHDAVSGKAPMEQNYTPDYRVWVYNDGRGNSFYHAFARVCGRVYQVVGTP